ncbi:Kynureninase (L-kynurenine hydrolase) [Candidozyma auris]|uniref:Kynureninase n=2 Tax=Candidozyma auris TaxID=498019 RepID=A0A2H1A7H0_CANAR|nr:kynureninase (l-kynurenine hydrolase) [[Candida] auris]PIS58819.1 kynureninase [[Candida] auris]QWW23133.1 hypothetical protein CA7LBN_001934 [[Candida] auris]
MASSEQLPTFKPLFQVPTFKSLGLDPPAGFHDESSSVYLAGNSLGLMPKATRQALADELDAWGARGVESHFNHPGEGAGKTSWVDIDLPLVQPLAKLVGATEKEVAAMGTLTSNLNALLTSFYKPSGKRTKIMFERHAFPSDYYAFLNMVKLHGYDESHLIQLAVAPGKHYLETEEIIEVIEKEGDEIAVICFPGVQYYTGQFFKIPEITAAAQKKGIVVGWDLAHAVGNVPLKLHEWNVDFAVWCSYKYLNSGPGGIAGIFVHERHTKNNSKVNYPPRLAGWWGNNAAERFKMLEVFDPINSALSYRQSNPSVIDCVALKSSLDVFELAGGLDNLRKTSVSLTGCLLRLLKGSKYYIEDPSDNASLGFKILTPCEESERGCQLSVLFQPHDDDRSKNVMEQVNEYLHKHAIICDERRPDVIRIAPTPLYNTLEDVRVVVKRIVEALDELSRS